MRTPVPNLPLLTSLSAQPFSASMLPALSSDGHLLPSLHKDHATVNEPDQRSTNGGSFDTKVQEKAQSSSSAVDAHGLQGGSSDERWVKLKASLFNIIGTVVLQTVAWTLFGVIWSKGTLPLPYIPTTLGMKAFTYVGSTITGALASLSSFFFSQAVLQYISVRMHGEGMSLADFVSSGQIASRSFIGDLTNLKLTSLSLAVLLLTSQQTPGWNVVLLPQFFVGHSDVTGRELDLRNTFLSNLSGDAIDFCRFNTSNLQTGLTVGQTENGFAAMHQDVGIKVSLTLMDFQFNTSTAGILPLVFDEIDVSPWLPNMTTIPWSLSPNVSLQDGISATSKTVQQGFSADVTCTFQDLKPDTTPSLVFENTTLGGGITSFRMSSNCAAPDADGPYLANTTSVDISIGDGSGSVLMIACGGPDESYKLIFFGLGLYYFMDTMVCTLTPKITTVRVELTYGITGGVVSTSTLAGGFTDLWGLPGLSAVTTIYYMMYFAQGVRTNIMGDQVGSMVQYYPDGALGATEAYLRGVTEYSGSVFRACLSAKGGGISADGVPQNMTILVHANFDTQFFGWSLTLFSSWVLLPGTFVAFATLYVVYLTWQHRPVDRKSKALDPADTMHIVSASAAGGLTGVLGGTDEDKEVQIVVGGFDAPTGRRVEPALIVKA